MLTTILTKLKTTRLRWLYLGLYYWGQVAFLAFLLAWGFPSLSLSEEAEGTNCPSTVTGLCTPGTFESSTSTSTEETSQNSSGVTTTTTTTTDTTTTTVTTPETGDLLTDSKVNSMGRNQRFGGDMSSDWGGQGPASMSSGSTCGDLGTDKCAQITGSSSFTSTHGQTGVGTTFRQDINMTHVSINPDIDRGGQVPWSLRVEKRDSSDSIHFRIRKSDGTSTVLLGTETLSAAGANTITNTLFQGNFSFSGAITTLSIEVSGRDINLAIGPLFDDVTVNVIYNVVNTIVSQAITTIEQFVALNIGVDDTTLEVAQDIFQNNNVGENPQGQFDIQPVGGTDQGPGPSYASVSAEINAEIPTPELQAPTIDTNMSSPPPTEIKIETQNVETEMQTEMQNDFSNDLPAPSDSMGSNEPSTTEGGPNTQESQPEPKTEVTEGPKTEDSAAPEKGEGSEPDSVDEPKSADNSNDEQKEEVSENESKGDSKTAESKSENDKNNEPKTEAKTAEKKSDSKPKQVAKKKQSKPKTKAQKKEAKEKAASKIVKKMGDKGRYDNTNQIKTLVVMQVLGNTREFFDNQLQLQDTPGFFTETIIPDAQLSPNNYGQYLMFGGSDAAHNALIEGQYK